MILIMMMMDDRLVSLIASFGSFSSKRTFRFILSCCSDYVTGRFLAHLHQAGGYSPTDKLPHISSVLLVLAFVVVAVVILLFSRMLTPVVLPSAGVVLKTKHVIQLVEAGATTPEDLVLKLVDMVEAGLLNLLDPRVLDKVSYDNETHDVDGSSQGLAYHDDNPGNEDDDDEEDRTLYRSQ
jgi:hypothetical protein